jgi:DGQHR domain-containing protein
MELDDQSPETIEYKAITGQFGEVRYFITTLSQNDAAENIGFADEIQSTWSFSERVQRKLDADRARTEIFSYLAKSGIRFFNSLVIVLLPSSNEQTEFWDFEVPKSQGKPIEKWVTLKLYKNVSRIVIDGQHRLLALKKYWNVHVGREVLSTAEASENFDCSAAFDIPAVFLIFGDLGRIGHLNKNVLIRDEIIKSTRNIFTVINKTAKTIDRQTQLLLDDTKLLALIPRKLLEDGVLEDKVVKWASKSTNLGQLDPYITTLDLVSKCTVELLKDYQKAALKKSFNSPEERSIALQTYYESHPMLPSIGTREIFRWFFHELQPFKDWAHQLEHLGISIPPQPASTSLSSSQKTNLKKLRESSILYTILGQRIVFFSISQFLLRKEPRYRVSETLNAIAESIRKMHDMGFLDRNAEHWQNIIVRPNERRTMITTGSGSDRCIDLISRMIFIGSSGGVRTLIQRVQKEVSEEANWTEKMIAEWRQEFSVKLPDVDDSGESISSLSFSENNAEDDDEESSFEIEASDNFNESEELGE